MTTDAFNARATEALSRISGMSLDRIKEIHSEVRANISALDNCARHRFRPEPVKMGQKVICLSCGGMMSLPDAGQYIRGCQAAGGNPDDVWPGWFKKEI